MIFLKLPHNAVTFTAYLLEEGYSFRACLTLFQLGGTFRCVLAANADGSCHFHNATGLSLHDIIPVLGGHEQPGSHPALECNASALWCCVTGEPDCFSLKGCQWVPSCPERRSPLMPGWGGVHEDSECERDLAHGSPEFPHTLVGASSGVFSLKLLFLRGHHVLILTVNMSTWATHVPGKNNMGGRHALQGCSDL